MAEWPWKYKAKSEDIMGNTSLHASGYVWHLHPELTILESGYGKMLNILSNSWMTLKIHVKVTSHYGQHLLC